MATKELSRARSRVARVFFGLACAAGIIGSLLIGGTATRASAQAPAPAAQPAPASAQPAAAPADAQGIVGVWQGPLHLPNGGKDLRIVAKITKNDKGELKAMFFSIDQGSQGFSASKVTFAGGDLKFSIDAIGGTYEGKMAADGKTIAGKWSQGPNPLDLSFERTTPDTAWPIPEPPKAMAADANPNFDVVTIKPSDPKNRGGKGFGFRGRHFVTINTNLNDLVAFAYGLHSKQIIDAPDWFGTELFDIDGTPDVEGTPNLKQMGLMVQKLLADRFKLTFHHDTRELSVYVISAGSGGPKMAKTALPPDSQLQGFSFRGLGDLTVTNMNMKEFASWMQSGVMDKPVVDQTGLTDKYDFKLKWTPDDSQFAQFRGVGAIAPPPTDDPNAPPSLYTAVQETLGLKMGPAKAPDDVIVIDHVEKPSAN